MCTVNNKLTCKRSLTSSTSINASSSDIWAPNVLECNFDFLLKLSNSNSLGYATIGSTTMNLEKTTLNLYYNTSIDIPGISTP